MDANFLVQEVTRAVLAQVGQNPALKIPPAERGELKNKIPAGISNRHAHLSQNDIATLFGKSALTVWKELSQPGQFAAQEQLTLVGPGGVIEKVRVLGPARKETQVEISPGDAIRLGLGRNVPVRESGDVKGSPGVALVGPAGSLTLKQGVIIAARHIHMHPQDAYLFGLTDKAVVSIETKGKRSVIFNEVIIRVSEQFKLEFHIDIDEANAAYLNQQDFVEIINNKY